MSTLAAFAALKGFETSSDKLQRLYNSDPFSKMGLAATAIDFLNAKDSSALRYSTLIQLLRCRDDPHGIRSSEFYSQLIKESPEDENLREDDSERKDLDQDTD